MPTLQEQFDDAMFEFSTGNVDGAIVRLNAILAQDPGYFDAQLALGGAYYARGDFASAIAEGHKAEKMKPHDQLVHTNLSRAYMKAGDKKTAEHHGLQARIASWRGDMAPPGAAPGADPGWRWPGQNRRPRQRRKNSRTCPGRRKRNNPHHIMKSSYELAMERLNKTAPATKLTGEQKKQLAELDAKYAAKIAEREIFLNDNRAAASARGDSEAVAQLEKQLASARKTFKAELEEKKEKVRQGN